MDQTARADAFHRLHQGPGLLVLPNAWDAASAALMADAGAKAVATSSAAVAWAHGYPDGDALPMAKLLATVEAIAAVTEVPLTVDFEGGYTDDPAVLADNIRAVIAAGAVGINFEDGVRDPDLHVRKIGVAREAAERSGVPLYINARTDVFLKRLAEGEAAVAEACRRAGLYVAAGASGVFVPGPVDEPTIAALVQGIDAPLNIMLRPGAPGAARLAALGVRRLSSATAPFAAAYGHMSEAVKAYLTDGEAASFAAGGALPNLNARFAARG